MGMVNIYSTASKWPIYTIRISLLSSSYEAMARIAWNSARNKAAPTDISRPHIAYLFVGFTVAFMALSLANGSSIKTPRGDISSRCLLLISLFCGLPFGNLFGTMSSRANASSPARYSPRCSVFVVEYQSHVWRWASWCTGWQWWWRGKGTWMISNMCHVFVCVAVPSNDTSVFLCSVTWCVTVVAHPLEVQTV